jgi:hypothetical protein
MTTFTSLADALHAGYDVIASTQSGYLVRLLRRDGAESYALAFGILSVLHTRLGKVNRRLGIACDPHSYARRIMALLDVPFRVFDNVENAIAAERRRERSAR